MSPEMKVFLMTLRAKEEQNLEDIRLGLLATLEQYQGFASVKQRFEEAIKGVKFHTDSVGFGKSD